MLLFINGFKIAPVDCPPSADADAMLLKEQ
jgi:hypothetical protein